MFANDFKNWEDVMREFAEQVAIPDELFLASYVQGNYEGEALVLYRNKDKYYLVYGSHCSCYGLEGQWNPEEFETRESFIKFLEQYKPYEHTAEVEEIVEGFKYV